MPWRRHRLTGEDESVGGELDLLGFRSPPSSSDPLIDHFPNLLDVPRVKATVSPDPLPVERFHDLPSHEMNVEHPPKGVGVVRPRSVRGADGVQDHVSRSHLQGNRVIEVEQFLVANRSTSTWPTRW